MKRRHVSISPHHKSQSRFIVYDLNQPGIRSRAKIVLKAIDNPLTRACSLALLRSSEYACLGGRAMKVALLHIRRYIMGSPSTSTH